MASLLFFEHLLNAYNGYPPLQGNFGDAACIDPYSKQTNKQTKKKEKRGKPVSHQEIYWADDKLVL